MPSFTISMNLICGLPLWLLPGKPHITAGHVNCLFQSCWSPHITNKRQNITRNHKELEKTKKPLVCLALWLLSICPRFSPASNPWHLLLVELFKHFIHSSGFWFVCFLKKICMFLVSSFLFCKTFCNVSFPASAQFVLTVSEYIALSFPLVFVTGRTCWFLPVHFLYSVLDFSAWIKVCCYLWKVLPLDLSPQHWCNAFPMAKSQRCPHVLRDSGESSLKMRGFNS